MLTCKSLFGLGYRGERLIEPSALVVDRAGGIFMNVPALVLLFQKSKATPSNCRETPRRLLRKRRHGRAVPPDHAPRGAPGTAAKAAGMVTSREAPGDIGSQRRRFS